MNESEELYSKGVIPPDPEDVEAANRPSKPSTFRNIVTKIAPFVGGVLGIGAATIPQQAEAQQIEQASPNPELVALDVENYQVRRIEPENTPIEMNEKGEMVIKNPGQRFRIIFDSPTSKDNFIFMMDNDPTKMLIVVEGKDVIVDEPDKETPDQKDQRLKSIYYNRKGVWEAGSHEVVVTDRNNSDKKISIKFQVQPHLGM